MNIISVLWTPVQYVQLIKMEHFPPIDFIKIDFLLSILNFGEID